MKPIILEIQAYGSSMSSLLMKDSERILEICCETWRTHTTKQKVKERGLYDPC